MTGIFHDVTNCYQVGRPPHTAFGKLPEKCARWENGGKTLQFQGSNDPKKINITEVSKREIRQFVDIMFICRELFIKSFQLFRGSRPHSLFSINLHKHNILIKTRAYSTISCKKFRKFIIFCLIRRNLGEPFVQYAD